MAASHFIKPNPPLEPKVELKLEPKAEPKEELKEEKKVAQQDIKMRAILRPCKRVKDTDTFQLMSCSQLDICHHKLTQIKDKKTEIITIKSSSQGVHIVHGLESACVENGLKLEARRIIESNIIYFAFYCKGNDYKRLAEEFSFLTKQYAETSDDPHLEIETTPIAEKGKNRIHLKSPKLDTLIDFLIWLKTNYALSFSLENLKEILAKPVIDRAHLIAEKLTDFLPPPRPIAPPLGQAWVNSFFGLTPSLTLGRGQKRKTEPETLESNTKKEPRVG